MTLNVKSIVNTGLLSLALVMTGCGGGGGGGNTDSGGRTNTTAGCTAAEEKEAIYSIMTDAYFWYEEVPNVNPTDYSTNQKLLDALIKPEHDRGHTYSYLTTVEEENAFLSNAAYVGYGFSMIRENDGRVYLRESFEGGPAYEAGMLRGDEVTAIDGVSVPSMSNSELNDALGPSEEGYTATFDVTHTDGSTATYEVSKAEVDTPVVAHVQTHLGTGGDTTYIFFRSFVDPAFQQLNAAFAEMKAAGDTRLILDLRYNGGGLVTVAQHLGSLIAGKTHDGDTVATLTFNDKYRYLNTDYDLSPLPNTVDISDLVVIMTGGTASASEMIINGLDPMINVMTVGSQSYGKPVGQSRFDFCEGKILRAIAFKVTNQDNYGDYFNGFAPDCAAEDDIFHDLGDTAEASVKEALNVLEGGACSTASAKARYQQALKMSLQPEGDPFLRDGWDVLIGGAR